MSRQFANWISAYQEFASFSEAPPHMHFWTAVSTIAGALRRRVWIDQHYFKWLANFYVLFVAPPGIVSKTTTISTGMRMLRRIPGIKFGPAATSWQALVKMLSESADAFQLPNGDWLQASSLTIESGEFGTLFDPNDKKMVDAFVSLWDGMEVFEKMTKGNGNDKIENPWINLIAATTPSWMSGNFPEYMIGGGFASRCIMVYIDEKAKFVAYPREVVPNASDEFHKRLLLDLEQISLLCGEYKLTPSAVEWGKVWYKQHCVKFTNFQDPRFGGYLARKQTHLHKLAMILSAARGDSLTITEQDLESALKALDRIEEDMPQVFSMIGRTQLSVQAERLIVYVQELERVSYDQAYRHVYKSFPTVMEFDAVISGACAANYIKYNALGRILMKGPVVYTVKRESEKETGPEATSPPP